MVREATLENMKKLTLRSLFMVYDMFEIRNMSTKKHKNFEDFNLTKVVLLCDIKVYRYCNASKFQHLKLNFEAKVNISYTL